MRLFRPKAIKQCINYGMSPEEAITRLKTNYFAETNQGIEKLLLQYVNLIKIDSMFCWGNTPEGYTFWQTVNKH